MALTPRQQRTILALGALSYRYFDLVTAGNEGGAAEVRRAFITLYGNGGRAALLEAGLPSRSLPTSIATSRGWYSAYRLASFAVLDGLFASSPEARRALTSMPETLSRLPAWWNGAGRPVLSARVTTSFLEALMEMEYAPLTHQGLTTAIDSYLADPTPIVDDWVDTGDTSPPSPGSTIADQPTTPTTATVRRPATTRSPSTSSSLPIQLPGTTVKPRAGSGANWLYVVGGVTILFGLGYGLWRIRRVG